MNLNVQKKDLKKSEDESFLFSQSTEHREDFYTSPTVVRLPWTDCRRIHNTQMWQGFTICSVIPWSIDQITSGFGHEESFLRVHLPDLRVDTTAWDVEQLPEVPEDPLQAAMEALDVAAVFVGKANDWSDDGDFYTAASDTEQESEPRADHSSAKQRKTDGISTPRFFQVKTYDMSEESSTVQSAKPLLDLIATNNAPLLSRYRLPALVIKAINLEYVRIRHMEAPRTIDVEEYKVYEQALANIKLDHDEIPEEILFWLYEVNGEFSRLCLEGPRNGSTWNLNAQFDQIMAFALNNVEWHCFCHMLMGSRRSVFAQPSFEAAESPNQWVMNMLGCDAQHHEYRSSENTVSEGEESEAGHHEGRELHHVNFNGDYVYKRSYTPPEVSFWAICTTKFKQLLDETHPHKATPAVHLKSVLTAQAFKYVDPIQYLGTNADAPTDAHGNYLTGSRLQDAVTGEVDVIYQSCGSWWKDEYSEDDFIPTQAMQEDDYHHASMREYVFLQWPYYVDPSDHQHDLHNFNGHAHLNPSFVSTRTLERNSASPLANVLSINDVQQKTPDKEGIATHGPTEEIVDRDIRLSIDPIEGDSDAETVIDADMVQEPRVMVDCTAGASHQATETAIFEAAWNAWEVFEQDKELEDAVEEEALDVQDDSLSSHAAINTAVGILTEDSNDNNPENAKDVAAPVTPALLLQFPNSASDAHHSFIESKYGEEAEDAMAANENAREADNHPSDSHTNDEVEIDQSTAVATTCLEAIRNKTGWQEAFARNLMPSYEQTVESLEALSVDDRLQWLINAASNKATSPYSGSADMNALQVSIDKRDNDNASNVQHQGSLSLSDRLALYADDPAKDNGFDEDLLMTEQDFQGSQVFGLTEPPLAETLLLSHGGRNVDIEKMIAAPDRTSRQSPGEGYSSWKPEANRYYASPRNLKAAATPVASAPAEVFSSTFNIATPAISQDPDGAQSHSKLAHADKVLHNIHTLLTEDTLFGSRLRPHRFFNATAPELLAPAIDLFPKQTPLQEELDKVTKDLSYFSSDEEEDGDADTMDIVGPHPLRKSSLYKKSSPKKLSPRKPSPRKPSPKNLSLKKLSQKMQNPKKSFLQQISDKKLSPIKEDVRAYNYSSQGRVRKALEASSISLKRSMTAFGVDSQAFSAEHSRTSSITSSLTPSLSVDSGLTDVEEPGEAKQNPIVMGSEATLDLVPGTDIKDTGLQQSFIRQNEFEDEIKEGLGATDQVVVVDHSSIRPEEAKMEQMSEEEAEIEWEDVSETKAVLGGDKVFSTWDTAGPFML